MVENISIKEYVEDNKSILRELFLELQKYEKDIYNGRAEPTNEFMDKIIDELLKEVAEKNGKIFMAFDNVIPVGFVAGFKEKDFENDTDYFRLDSLFVVIDYRKRGIGSELVGKSVEYAKSIGLTQVGLGVLSGNKNAYQYYQKRGFKDYGIELLKDI